MKRIVLVAITAIALITVASIGAQQRPDQSAKGAEQATGGNTVASATAPPKAAIEPEGPYRVGPGDLLDIRVLGHAELSLETRLDGSTGIFRLPFVEGEIRGNCLTEQQLEDLVRQKYTSYLKHPMVSVHVKEYKSRPVEVIGAVKAPAQVFLTRRARILDIINAAGGLTSNAGTVINVLKPSEHFESCDGSTAVAAVADDGDRLETIDRRLLLTGDPRVNRFVRPGETIEVPEAKKVYVTGNVFQPTVIPLTERLTLSRVLAFAGGVQPATKKDQISIERSDPNTGERQETKYNLSEIEKGKKPDPVLQENDVIFVPTSGTRSLLNGLIKNTVANPYLVRQIIY